MKTPFQKIYTKPTLWVLVLLILFWVLGNVFYSSYLSSPQKIVDIQHFRDTYLEKEQQTRANLALLWQQIESGNPPDSLEKIDFQDKNILYCVYSKKQIAYWSDNMVAPTNDFSFHENTVDYIKLSNAHCVYVCEQRDDVKLVALILLKFQFSIETAMLVNRFAAGFDTNNMVGIERGRAADINAVFSADGRYLFSLQTPYQTIFNNQWLLLSFFACLLFFVLFFVLYTLIFIFLVKKQASLGVLLLLAAVVALLTGLMLFYQVPAGFFKGAALVFKGFSTGGLWSVSGYLTLTSFYCFSTVYLFCLVNKRNIVSQNKIVLVAIQAVFFGLFLLFYSLLRSTAFNSVSGISVLSVSDFIFPRLWMHILFLSWGLSIIFLFFKVFAWVKSANDYFVVALTNIVFLALLAAFSPCMPAGFALPAGISFAVLLLVFLTMLYYGNLYSLYSNLFSAIYIVVMMGIVAVNLWIFETKNLHETFHRIATAILTENPENSHSATQLRLQEIQKKISTDTQLKILLAFNDSFVAAKQYIEDNYLFGYFINYKLEIHIVDEKSTVYQEYTELMQHYGTKINQTDFYQISDFKNDSYMGIFDLNSEEYLVLTLESVKQFNSYSFPDLLTESEQEQFSGLKIATAKYENGNLTTKYGKFVYPPTTSWISDEKASFFQFIFKEKQHFILRESNNAQTLAVVTDLRNHSIQRYFFYLFYSFLAYFFIFWLTTWILSSIYHKQLKIGLLTRFQYMFLAIFLFCFAGFFFFSYNTLKKRYRQQQQTNITEKIHNIQQILQREYYYSYNINESELSGLDDILKELSYIFQTDIHIYDTNGLLLTTTQPAIFNKNLISRRICPHIYFTNLSDLSENEQIGSLNYLIHYSEFFNGDNLLIGYLAIPQYFSELEMNNEVTNYLQLIIHIYTIAFFISLIFSNIIKNRLYRPLQDLECKLREMQIGKHNEKIDYHSNDEISQLVEQYNNTVDELERSAQLIAKLERESAWKLMARQVAHEINNPLTPMKLTIQQLQRTRQMNDEQFDAYFEKSTKILVEQIDNLSLIANTFSNFAKLPEAKFEKINLTEIVSSVVELFTNNEKQAKVTLTAHKSEVLVCTDPEQLRRVFNNLIKNAIQAIPAANVNKTVTVQIFTKNHKAVVEVADNGIGISPEVAEKLFVPNFTTKGTGTGLGLAISKNIVETAGGKISFQNNHSGGATFCVELPEI